MKSFCDFHRDVLLEIFSRICYAIDSEKVLSMPAGNARHALLLSAEKA